MRRLFDAFTSGSQSQPDYVGKNVKIGSYQVQGVKITMEVEAILKLLKFIETLKFNPYCQGDDWVCHCRGWLCNSLLWPTCKWKRRKMCAETNVCQWWGSISCVSGIGLRYVFQIFIFTMRISNFRKKRLSPKSSVRDKINARVEWPQEHCPIQGTLD